MKNKDEDEYVAFCVCMVLAFLFGLFMGAWIGNESMWKAAINNNAAHCDSKTGVKTWNEP